MHPFKKNIFKTSDDDETPPTIDYCSTWEAHNESNIKMSTTGTIDFTAELGSRNIDNTPGLSVGTVYQYKFAGDPDWVSADIDMTFTLKKANWSTDALVARTDQVLTGIRFTIEIICTNASEISLPNVEQFAAVTPSPQLDAYYDTCST